MWIEMPAVSDGPNGVAVRPKYPSDVSVLVVYRAEHAYVAVDDDSARLTTARYHDARLLTDREAREFEQRMGLPHHEGSGGRSRVVRLGDLVHRVTRTARIAECQGCQRRRTIWNKVIVWGWWRAPSS